MLTKNTIVEVEAAPFKQWLKDKHGEDWQKTCTNEQLKDGKNNLMAAITSRPGQSGRADGRILTGKELEF